MEGGSAKPRRCPECGSERLCRDGIRYLISGETIQRWLCKECGRRFSETSFNNSNRPQRVQKVQRQILNSAYALTFNCQGSREATLSRAPTSQGGLVKTLAEVEKFIGEKQAAGATVQARDVKGKILEFAWWLKKQGYSEHTIKNYAEFLKLLAENGADILDPESVKEVLARLDKSSSWKHHTICAVNAFYKMVGLTWEKPKCVRPRVLPFIPLENELDSLIAGAGKKTAAFLQLLKETGMRAGEALRLKWTDVDFERQLIILNQPEKGGEPRVFKVSSKLIGMLNALPRKDERIFPLTYNAMKWGFILARKKIALKLANPRLLQISFHTFRHWKATMEYHKTRDPLHVKELLGHKKLDTTLMYIQIEKTIFQDSNDEFTVKIAKTPEEIKALLEVGFEYVCEKDGANVLQEKALN